MNTIKTISIAICGAFIGSMLAKIVKSYQANNIKNVYSTNPYPKSNEILSEIIRSG